MVNSIKESLALERYIIVIMSTNCVHMFLKKVMRASNRVGFYGYDKLLQPIAEELQLLRELDPMTIFYMKLKYCGNMYSLSLKE